jgi:NTP pyrophosphatase (non-canonical NTP hydrolase)
MYDIVWNIIDLANKLNINLENAFEKKIEINKHRTW